MEEKIIRILNSEFWKTISIKAKAYIQHNAQPACRMRMRMYSYIKQQTTTTHNLPLTRNHVKCRLGFAPSVAAGNSNWEGAGYLDYTALNVTAARLALGSSAAAASRASRPTSRPLPPSRLSFARCLESLTDSIRGENVGAVSPRALRGE